MAEIILPKPSSGDCPEVFEANVLILKIAECFDKTITGRAITRYFATFWKYLCKLKLGAFGFARTIEVEAALLRGRLIADDFMRSHDNEPNKEMRGIMRNEFARGLLQRSGPLPRMSSLEALRRLQAAWPKSFQPETLMLTEFGAEEHSDAGPATSGVSEILGIMSGGRALQVSDLQLLKRSDQSSPSRNSCRTSTHPNTPSQG